MTYTMALPNENTVGRAEARKALAESRASAEATDKLIEESRQWIAQVANIRQENHFTQKMRAIIQGAK